jgi:hypothetical protein
VTAIGVDFESGPFAVAMSEEDAVAALLSGHRAGAYVLPSPLVASCEGAAAVISRATAVHDALNKAVAALREGPGRLVAELVRETATAGRIPKTDLAAVMVLLEADVERLAHEDRVFSDASLKIGPYPSTIARSIAPDIHAALAEALSGLLDEAKPSSAQIAALPPGATDLSAHRTDAQAYDRLEALTGRLAAIESAAAALSRLGRPWDGLPADDGSPAVLRLARLASTAAAQ